MENPTGQVKPWYREPWPWVAIAIPAAAVLMGVTTLILAISNPDPLTIDERTYQDIRSELTADPAQDADGDVPETPRNPSDGDH
ncbi:MAG: FixH family protein [Xanthomonadales bacterium]|jgi:hypothetical protein